MWDLHIKRSFGRDLQLIKYMEISSTIEDGLRLMQKHFIFHRVNLYEAILYDRF